MELRSVRDFVLENPGGVQIRMVDGRTFDVPHRDYVSFGPIRENGEPQRGPKGTSFILWENGQTFRLLNALLICDLTPLNKNGDSDRHKENPMNELQ